jgi:hypothetical protein
MNTELLNLPWQIQVAIAGGYAGYMIAYAGLRHTHRQIDTIFISIIFSLIASGAIATLTVLRILSPPLLAGSLAFFITCLAAIAWRKWGRRVLELGLRLTNATWANDDSSALTTLTANVKCPVTQIAVLLDDGTWLRCDDTTLFNDAPFGPCLLGPSGDVALYLTHEEPPKGKIKKLKSVRDSYYGDRITYVPASRIRQITIRHLTKPSHSWKAAG